MVAPRILQSLCSKPSGRRNFGIFWLIFLLLVCSSFSSFAGRGGRLTQFDAHLGFDEVIPEAGWFPVVCEIKNDGAPFVGYIEVSASTYGPNQSVRVPIELPTGTLKRVSIPVFCASMYNSRWDVRLCTERGRVVEEQAGISPKRQVPTETVIIGSLAHSVAGTPSIRPITRRDGTLQPVVGRFLQTALVPDNPLVLEAMDVFYLNSEHAPEFSQAQINALLAWLHNGGHLIVAVESATDITGTPWLHNIFPCEVGPPKEIDDHSALQSWLRRSPEPGVRTSSNRQRSGNLNANYPNSVPNYVDDSDFEKAQLEVATATVQGAKIEAGTSETPLIVTGQIGRGRITALLFSPEREPVRSWKNYASFWTKVTEIPADLYTTENMYPRSSWSVDGVFGAMIDSKQIRKLPVEWLLLLLVLYLVVIGPLDQYWLKRIKRPMLTWITFPCYVVAFSLMIYFIGYKLRAGETEWNELHIVDVLAKGDGAELRGRTYASVYSPVNATYRVEGKMQYSTFRGEYQAAYGGNQGGDERADIYQSGDNFHANIFVPVWTSQLYMSDWWEQSPMPLDFTISPEGQGWSVTVNNMRDRPLNNIHIAIGGRLTELGSVPAGQKKTFSITRTQGETLASFVQRYANSFQSVSQSRRQAFGASSGGRLFDVQNNSLALSFLSYTSQQWNFVIPPGLDLSDLLDQGQAVLLAWEPDYSPVAKPLNQFPTRRSHKDTLWRVAIPINASVAPAP